MHSSILAARSYPPMRIRPAVADRRYAHRPRQLRLLQRDVHTVSGEVESQPAGLGVQLDDDAMVVLEIGDRAALYNRDASRDCCIIAAEIRRTRQVVNLSLSGNAGAPYVSYGNARQFELVLLLVFAVVKRAVTPAIADTEGK